MFTRLNQALNDSKDMLKLAKEHGVLFDDSDVLFDDSLATQVAHWFTPSKNEDAFQGTLKTALDCYELCQPEAASTPSLSSTGDSPSTANNARVKKAILMNVLRHPKKHINRNLGQITALLQRARQLPLAPGEASCLTQWIRDYFKQQGLRRDLTQAFKRFLPHLLTYLDSDPTQTEHADDLMLYLMDSIHARGDSLRLTFMTCILELGPSINSGLAQALSIQAKGQYGPSLL